MIVKLLTEENLEFLSLKGDCRGSSYFTLVKMPHCWKSHALAHFLWSISAGYPTTMIYSRPWILWWVMPTIMAETGLLLR